MSDNGHILEEYSQSWHREQGLRALAKAKELEALKLAQGYEWVPEGDKTHRLKRGR